MFELFDLCGEITGSFLQTSVSEGGLVPKNLYLTTGDIDREGFSLKEDSLYHSISLGKSQLHEVVIHIDEPHTVITWDFDVMLQDVVFSVLVTNLPITSKETSCIGDSEHKCAIDKNWKEGKDYFKVESPIVCHDGESVQVGFHIPVLTRVHDNSSNNYSPIIIQTVTIIEKDKKVI